jgi:salicylate 5-hydroxylase large subunit
LNSPTDPALPEACPSGEAAMPRLNWLDDDVSRVPFGVYTDPDVYRRELARIFHGPHWSYVGLECEIPRPGDFKTTFVGERAVIVVRDRDGGVNVLENRCAHRGVRFCQQDFGHARNFTCPYHQWNYDLKGNLIGLPFRRGVRRVEDGQTRIDGGMPEDFRAEDHGLAQFVGGPPPWRDLRRSFDAWRSSRWPITSDPASCPGSSGSSMAGNSRCWAIPASGYRATGSSCRRTSRTRITRVCCTPGSSTFGLWRADQKSRMVMDDHHRHAVMISRRNDGGKAEVTQGVASFREDMKLHDPAACSTSCPSAGGTARRSRC